MERPQMTDATAPDKRYYISTSRSEGLVKLRYALRELIERHPKKCMVLTAPRYDDVYFEGVAYLDAIARGEIDG